MTEKLSFPSSKENGSTGISKDEVENCLGTINMCFFWISLTVVTLSADCYYGICSLRQPFFAKVPGYFDKVLSFCMKMPGVIQPTGLTAACGCTSDRLWIGPNLTLSVLSLTESLRSTWLASDCNRCCCEPSRHLLATDTRQVSLPRYHCGANSVMVAATTLRSDVYHLLDMCHVIDQSHKTF